MDFRKKITGKQATEVICKNAKSLISTLPWWTLIG